MTTDLDQLRAQLLLPLRWYPFPRISHMMNHPLEQFNRIEYIGHKRLGRRFIMNGELMHGKS